MSKTNAGKITLAYNSFWMKFKDICKRHTMTQFLFDFKLVDYATSEYEMALKEPLYFREWPYKTASTNDVVDILIKATERINIDNMHIVYSNVEVAYYKLKDGQHTLLESFHYDFDKQEPSHPTFHVQLCCQGISGLPQDFQRLRGNVDNRIIRHENLRIPTAHMSLISVLVSIVADHLSSQELNNLIQEIRGTDNLPQVDPTRISGIVSNGDFCSLLWYP